MSASTTSEGDAPVAPGSLGTRTDGTTGADSQGSVVFVSQQYPPDRSGHASRIHDMATSLAADGWDVTVLAPPASFPPESFDRSWRFRETTTTDGVAITRLWAWQPSAADPGFLTRMAYYILFAAHATLWLLFNGRRYDAIVTTTPPISTGVAGMTARLTGTRWVVDVRDLWIDASISLGFLKEGSALERVSRRYQRVVLHRADSIAVTTETLGDHLCDQYGQSLAPKIQLVPNGVDLARFRSTMDDKEHEDRTANQPPIELSDGSGDDFVLIYTGNIGHAQDLGTCIEALSLLPDGVRLRLVGGGDAVPELKQKATAEGVRARVDFVDPVPQEQIPQLLDAAQVGLAPLADDAELSYAMPTKVYEYLCCELPVVATGTGELRRFIEESNGGMHASNDSESIAAAIESLRSDPEARTLAGKRGYEHVRETYDRADIAEQFGAHLTELLDPAEETE